MFLTDTDEVYVRVGPGKDVKIGQELTIFRPVRKVAGGNSCRSRAAIRVNEWNEKDRVARGTIVETLDVVERGARVGPIGRKFDVVPRRATTPTCTRRCWRACIRTPSTARSRSSSSTRARTTG